MALFSRTLARRLALLLVGIACIYGIHIAVVQRDFERYLNSLTITSDDFPPDYTDALIAAQRDGHPIDYNDYTAFQSNDPDSQIPPIIHFIFFERLYDAHLDISEIPTHGSPAPDHCRTHNPNFSINVWNATAARDLLATHYAWFLPTYDGYAHPIQRVDAFKYFVLWHYGGIYMDLDVDCRRPLDPLLQFPAWWPKTALLGVNNDVFAARKQHPVVVEMTAQLMSRDVGLLFPYLTVYYSTGPQFTSDVLKGWYRSGRDAMPLYTPGESKKDGGLDRFYILPEDFYSETYTFFGHSPGGTWHGSDVAVILWFVAHPWVVPLVLVCPPLGIWLAWTLRRRRLERVRAAYARVSDA